MQMKMDPNMSHSINCGLLKYEIQLQTLKYTLNYIVRNHFDLSSNCYLWEMNITLMRMEISNEYVF